MPLGAARFRICGDRIKFVKAIEQPFLHNCPIPTRPGVPNGEGREGHAVKPHWTDFGRVAFLELISANELKANSAPSPPYPIWG